jgi:hypothetical protein
VPDVGVPDASIPACPAGQVRCNGACVSATDPLYGCGSPACTPCSVANGTPVCRGNVCAVAACAPGHADCNNNPADGCETDLSRATTCGACTTACGPTAPLCTPVGATFRCSTGCGPAAPILCGAQCVNPLSNPNHCGSCNVACPPRPNATAACDRGVCTSTCNPGFHACGATCVAANDPKACGPACTVCPAPANGVATCTNGVCGGTCNPPYRACGGRCVAPNDPTACGAACIPCAVGPNATASCVNDTCTTSCSPGYIDCNANPADGCETPAAVGCGDAGP